MRIPPFEVISSWPPPNYDDPDTRGPANEIIAVTLLSIATVVVAIRIYTRNYITHGFGWDDILIVLAYIPATAFVIVGMIATTHFGWGRHIWDVPIERLPVTIRMGLASQILFDLATSFTKLSMLALIYRIASEASNKLRILVICLEVFISVNCIVFILAALLQCRPLSLYWTLSFKPQNCFNEAAHLLTAGIINTVTDFVLVLLPLVLVRIYHKDKLSSRQMLIVNLLFGVGFLASFAGVTRTYFTWLTTTRPDVTWNAWMNWLMSAVELLLAIICASVPSTKPFFNRYIPKLLSSSCPRSMRKSAATYSDRATKRSDICSQPTIGSELEDVVTVPLNFATSKTPIDANRFSETMLNKPLPAIMNKNSVYTIKIQLDEASLSPSDRTRLLSSQSPDIDRRQTVRNFSRLENRQNHTRNRSEPPRSLQRPNPYSEGGDSGSRPPREASDSRGSSRHSQGHDDYDSQDRRSIDDMEARILPKNP